MSIQSVLAEIAAAAPSPGVTPSALTADRLWSLAAALLGLAGVVAGALALARPAGRIGSRGAVVALAAGPAGTVIGGAVLLTADGGPGTGNGTVGGYVALVLGVLAIVLGGLARARSARRSAA
ncbi:DUF6223 family protein [Nonomuraea rubra]|uniref:Uncharacterized protein n=1 Tax=Nonomuraea rubra TaxID=46180 RepID=A0A7X0P1P2_9ACTN|nr:DUF6223 family protein [Nonomuraea rubra]MBB6553644.1 hypothetical protein [Nonomuraea rubra]